MYSLITFLLEEIHEAFEFCLIVNEFLYFYRCDSENRYVGNPLRGTCYCKYLYFFILINWFVLLLSGDCAANKIHLE